ncbi:hypothetical protein ACLUWI_03290 [Limosilactobacillus mucosae]|uniref:hypothetical protein n=1 Tax=Limosilactobacillus mucosae TaxID=97478 RepID=UPI00265F1240|nr:hypothetical protein [Limosilactobacillus mucosae]
MNTIVGKTMPSELLDLTPLEYEYITAGGAQRAYNQLNDGLTVAGAVMSDESGYDQILAYMRKRQSRIDTIADQTKQERQKQQADQAKRFAELFIFGERRDEVK